MYKSITTVVVVQIVFCDWNNLNYKMMDQFPFVYKKDFVRIDKKFSDCAIVAFNKYIIFSAFKASRRNAVTCYVSILSIIASKKDSRKCLFSFLHKDDTSISRSITSIGL